MADSQNPNDWMSYADYLGLNEASLRELEAAAGQERAQADDASQAALGASYQEAQRDVEAGGQGNLTATASYGDFLKAQREAQKVRAVRGNGYEAAARGSMMAPDTSWTAPRNDMQGRLDQRRVDIGQGKANVAKFQAGQKAERDAQAKAFSDAEAKMGDGWKNRVEYGKYSDAVDKSFTQAAKRPVPRGAPRLRNISDEEYNTYSGGK